MPGPGWYLLGQEELDEVTEVLRSRELSRYRFDDDTGEVESKVMQFERFMSEKLGVRHVLGLNSCTSALLTGLLALGVEPGDEVIVPGYTFIASIAAVLYAGARPVLAEIDASLTLDPVDVAAKLSPATRVIMPVHMLGAPADMAALQELARSAGCALLEDVAQACGGAFRGARLGTIGDLGAFSLGVGKTITSGDGGLLTTRSTELYRRAFAIHDHGFAPNRAGVLDRGPRVGLNLRMHELTGAVAVAQARKLDTILDRCRMLKQAVVAELDQVGGTTGRLVHDSGECATFHVMLFEDAGRARRVAAALGGDVLAASPKHNYAKMAQLHADFAASVKYAREGALPRTDDILNRGVAVSIGVVDGYLGTTGRITVLDSPADAATKAMEMRRLIEATP